MATQNIEFSKQGFKFSYNRFLADSSAGFLIILIAIITYYNSDIAFQIRENFQTSTTKEVEILLCILFFMLSTPLGLMINALSWIILGWPQTKIKIQCFDNDSFLIKSTKNEFQFKDCVIFFGLTKNNWVSTSTYWQNLLDVHRGHLIESSNYLEGLTIFIRNLSLMAFFLPLIYIILCLSCIPEQTVEVLRLLTIIYPLCIIFALFMLFLGSIVSFYYDLKIFSKAYIFCKKKEFPSEISGDIEKMVDFFLSIKADAEE